MRPPVDSGTVNSVTAEPAESVVDLETTAPTLDGCRRLVRRMHVHSVEARNRDVLAVKVVGEPTGCREFTPVRVTDDVATTRTTGGRSGVSFPAASVEPVTPSTRSAS